MRTSIRWGSTSLAILALVATPAARAQKAPATPASWAPVETALGRKGAMQPGDVLKFGFPRSDLAVTVDGVRLQPALALGSWVAFRSVGNGQAMAMGDLVLTEDEVAPVMRALASSGIEITALHNHLLRETPHVMYMHVAAHGDAAIIARSIHDALAKSGTPLTSPTASPTPATDLDTAGIASALGVRGKLNGAVYQVSVPRREKITGMEHDVPPAMGVATGINFQSTGAGKAAITGDFVLTTREVNPVLRALTQHGIAVTAVHSHMLGEAPRLYFMHFWANDDAVTLAKGVRAALDRMNVRATLRAHDDDHRGASTTQRKPVLGS